MAEVQLHVHRVHVRRCHARGENIRRVGHSIATEAHSHGQSRIEHLRGHRVGIRVQEIGIHVGIT